MKLKNILIVVNDIQKSIRFYKDLFGLDVVLESEGNVILTEGLVLQDAQIWKVHLNREILSRNHAAVLYFEEWDMDGFVKKLETYQEMVEIVEPLTEFPWGQKMIRFYDLDGTMIEVRTPM